MKPPRSSFTQTITDAVADMTAHGFDSEQRVLDWVERIRAAALADLTPMPVVEKELARVMEATYTRQVERGGILSKHPGVPQYTIDRVKPKLRAELDRRIMTSTSLIKLNRPQAVAKTLQRFQGWATSIPAGGSKVVEKVPVKSEIRKALAQLPFEERRLVIDQGAKLVSAISNIVAVDGGAIAVEWHSHWRDASYNYRPDHKARDGKVYAIKGNWAIDKGLMKAGPNGYYEDNEAFAEAPFCRCFGTYIYALRRLPDDMLTEKGRQALVERGAR